MRYLKYYKPASGKFPKGIHKEMFKHVGLVFIVDNGPNDVTCVYMSDRNGDDDCECLWIDIPEVPKGCKKTTEYYFNKCVGEKV